MHKSVWLAFALLGCAASGCSPHTADHGLGADLAGTAGSGEDMAFPTGSDEDMAGPLSIAPLDQVVIASPGQMPTVQYSAMVNGASVAPAWTIDRGEIGNVGVANGLFTAGGAIAGKANVTATLNGQKVSTTITVKFMQTQNGDPGYPAPMPGAGGFGGVGGSGPGPAASNGQTGVLTGAPTADAAVKMLYPYDGTVFPRGLFAPLLQWSPGARNFDAVMIKLHSKNFDYTGTFAKNATPFVNIPLPQAVWKTLTYSNGGAGDDVTVTLVFEDISGAPTAIGPYTMTWKIAPGTLKGTVYYNSYGTALVKNSALKSCGPGEDLLATPCKEGNNVRSGPYFGAATLAIKPGASDPVVAAGTTTGSPAGATDTGCRTCHSVSSNGATLFTQHGDAYQTSSSYALTMANAEAAVTPSTNLAFPALSPDGTWLLSSVGTINGDSATRAYTVAGALIGAQPTLPTGWSSFGAAYPVFSPDGKHLSFNYQFSVAGATTNDGKSLAVLDYDSVNKVFSNFHKLDTPAVGADAWSSFLPTNDAVVFENEPAYPDGFGHTRYGNKGQLWWVDLATRTPHALDKLNGVGYLPTSASHTDDTVLGYEPTVNPVVSGGYAWVVFTSRRLYGNVATLPPWTSDPRNYDWTTTSKGMTTKKLWVAAIDLNAAPGTDPSHPAFYLPGQELVAGNARGFWTVDPCHADGTSCETGDECCGGYCRPGGGDMGALICTNVQPMCAAEFEKCNVTADCCGAAQGLECIGGKCSKSSPIP
ncbi:MAG: hypothetical protein JWN44_6752 [Myxococcales bacterium]|nr:hypothetical protein [Myxococcales bacterium]